MSKNNGMCIVWSEAYFRAMWHLDPSSRLATTDMGQKFGARGSGYATLGKLGPHLT